MSDLNFNAADVRYIKLGPGNAWFDHAVTNNLLELGHRDLPHEVAQGGDYEAIRKAVAAYKPNKATSFATEVHAFYTLPPGSLWITFADKRMWWATAGDQVTWLGDASAHGARGRSLQTGWRSTDVNGAELWIEELPGSLTRTAGFKMSICKVAAADKAIQRILGRESEIAVHARNAKRDMIAAATAMISQLQPDDFEILADLVFASSGWKRIGQLGGVQRDTDLVLQQSITRETAFVQVKSAADQRVFAHSVEAFQRSGLDLMFFMCHSPTAELRDVPDDVIVLSGGTLAERAIEAGHFDWLLAKAR